MRKTIKRILGIMVACSLVVMSSIVAFADDKAEIEGKPTAAVAENIYEVNSDEYLMDVEGTFVSVGRLDVDLSSEDEVNAVMRREDVEDVVKEEIYRLHVYAVETNQDLVTSYYSPELLDNSKLRGITYHTYEGHNMKAESLVTTGVSTGWEYISSGKRASDVADTVTNVGLWAAGLTSSVVSFLSAGKTVLDFFIEQWGSSYITGHNNDYFQMRLIYDCEKQWIFTQVGSSWNMGLATQKVTVTKVGTEQYYYNGSVGKTTTRDDTVSVTKKSQHFESPWATAYSNQNNPQTEWISWKVASKTFTFS